MNITPVRSASYFPYLIEIDMIRRIKLELLEISWKDSHFSFIFLDAFYWSLDVLQLAFKVKPSFQNDIPSFITMITMDPMKMSAPLGHSISYCSFFFVVGACWWYFIVIFIIFFSFSLFFGGAAAGQSTTGDSKSYPFPTTAHAPAHSCSVGCVSVCLSSLMSLSWFEKRESWRERKRRMERKKKKRSPRV